MSNMRNNNCFRGRTPPGPSNVNRQQTVNPWEGGVAPGGGNSINSSFLPNSNRGNHNNSMGNTNFSNFGNPNTGYQNMRNMRNSGGLLPTPGLQPGLLPEPSVQAQLANNVLNLLLPHQQQQMALNPMNLNRTGGLLPLIPPGGHGHYQNRSISAPLRSHGGFAGPDRSRPDKNQMGTSSWYERPGSHGQKVEAKITTQQARYSNDGKAESSRNDRTDTMEARDRNSFDSLKEAYSEISSDLLHCHICEKYMWDSLSFVKHIKGKAHLAMVDKLEEKYKQQLEVRRHEVKIEEQNLERETREKFRLKKNIGIVSNTMCAMCSIRFFGNLTFHRQSIKHQQLKSFLHPKCGDCKKEFSSRIDWDHHLLSPGHMKEIENIRSKRSGERSVNKRGNGATEDNTKKRLKQSSQDQISEAKDSKVENGTNMKTDAKKYDGEPKDVAVAHKDVAVVKEVKNENKSESVISPQNVSKKDSTSPTPLSVTKSIEDIPLNYDPHLEIGLEMLQEKTGYLCRCCNRFLSSSADSKTHCRSKFHFDKYVTFIKSKIPQTVKSCTPNEKVATPASGNDKIIVPSTDNELQSPSTAKELKSSSGNDLSSMNNDEEKSKEESTPVKMEQEEEEDEEEDDESGNWKRKKVLKEDGETPTSEKCPGPVN